MEIKSVTEKKKKKKKKRHIFGLFGIAVNGRGVVVCNFFDIYMFILSRAAL